MRGMCLGRAWTYWQRCSAGHVKIESGSTPGKYLGLLLFANNCWILAVAVAEL